MGWDGMGEKDGWMHGAARRGEGTSAHWSRVGLRGVLSFPLRRRGCLYVSRISFLAPIAFFWAACRDTLLTFLFYLFLFPSANGGSKSTLLYVHPAATGWNVCLSVCTYVCGMIGETQKLERYLVLYLVLRITLPWRFWLT